MKELLLTSGGVNANELKSFYARLLRSKEVSRIAVIFSERQPEDIGWAKENERLVHDLGFKPFMVNVSEEVDVDRVADSDSFYVCGGNTFYILDRLRKTGLDLVLRDGVRKGKVYLGISAGSIIAGPDIEIAGYGRDADRNDIGLSDINGLALIDFHIFPHFSEEEKPHLEAFYGVRKAPTVAITDVQALYVSNDAVKLIGNPAGCRTLDTSIAIGDRS